MLHWTRLSEKWSWKLTLGCLDKDLRDQELPASSRKKGSTQTASHETFTLLNEGPPISLESLRRIGSGKLLSIWTLTTKVAFVLDKTKNTLEGRATEGRGKVLPLERKLCVANRVSWSQSSLCRDTERLRNSNSFSYWSVVSKLL